MTAAEAREKSESKNAYGVALALIYHSISAACEQGRFLIQMDGKIHPVIRKVLEEDGYTVQTYFNRNTDTYHVSWNIIK